MYVLFESSLSVSCLFLDTPLSRARSNEFLLTLCLRVLIYYLLLIFTLSPEYILIDGEGGQFYM